MSQKLALAILASYVFTSASEFCSIDSVKDRDYPYRYYQTKTLYDVARGSLMSTDRPGAECSPIHIVLVSRHGSRHPGADEADIYQSLKKLTEKLNSTGKAEMCKNDLEKIQQWVNWHVPELDKDLAVTGYEEMQGLAKRYSEVFPELLTGDALNASNHRFISSDSRRSEQSASAFIEKLFENTGKEKPVVEKDDRLLKFYDYCEKYLKEIDDNDTVTEDADKFLEGPYMTAVADRFASRVGIPRNEVTNDLVDEVRKEGCAEEEWATGNHSAWCLAFTKEDLEVFEYAEDMEDYLEKSFGYEISYRPSCILKRFVLSALKNASNMESSSPLGHFTFGHSQTIMSLLTEMKLIPYSGLLKSTDYPQNINRSFRGSLYEPGSANILFILYGCGETNEKKIQIFHNEKLVEMPLDDPVPGGLWNLDDALEYFNYDAPEDCDLEKLCAVDEEGVTDTMTTTTGKANKIPIRTSLLVFLTWLSLNFSMLQ